MSDKIQSYLDNGVKVTVYPSRTRMKVVVCLHCKQEFDGQCAHNPAKQKFCSIGCGEAFRRKKKLVANLEKNVDSKGLS